MKKKGFTLVELLAVIAILAILVIVAMPNVLGRFNSAKVSSFKNEVQTILKEANSQFVQDSLTSTGAITYTTSTTDTNTLDLDGGLGKKYTVIMDSQGNVTNLLVYDDSYCLYAAKSDGVTSGEVKDAKVKEYNGETEASTACGGKEIE